MMKSSVRKVDDWVYWGALPSIEQALELIRKHNVRLFINLYGYAGYEDYVEREGAHVIVYPIEELSFAPVEEVHFRILSKIQAEREGKTFIHCYAGIGRSGTLVCMYLIKKGIDYDTAFMRVKTLCPLWPESYIQLVVPRWYNRLLEKVGIDVMKACFEEGSKFSFGTSLEHASTVANIALDILETFIKARLIEISGWEWKVTYAAGILHDVGRYDARDEVHHIRSIEIIESMKSLRKIFRGIEREILKLLVVSHRASVDPRSDAKFRLIPDETKAIILTSCIKIADAFLDVYKIDIYSGCRMSKGKLVIYTNDYIKGRVMKKSQILRSMGIDVTTRYPN